MSPDSGGVCHEMTLKNWAFFLAANKKLAILLIRRQPRTHAMRQTYENQTRQDFTALAMRYGIGAVVVGFIGTAILDALSLAQSITLF